MHREGCNGRLVCVAPRYSSLPQGEPEFHAEWLRDEPCDATTTGPRKTGVSVSTLARQRGT